MVGINRWIEHNQQLNSDSSYNYDLLTGLKILILQSSEVQFCRKCALLYATEPPYCKCSEVIGNLQRCQRVLATLGKMCSMISEYTSNHLIKSSEGFVTFTVPDKKGPGQLPCQREWKKYKEAEG
jgi:hypothetical protein